MIYKKEANFPYPVLTNYSESYDNCTFTLDIDLIDDIDNYQLHVSYDTNSEFLSRLIEMKKADLVLIVQSRDNKFYQLSPEKMIVSIAKSRITLNDRITIQLLIKALDIISFKENHDLIKFYDNVKEDITVPVNGILAISNTIIFDGKSKKPLELFERKVDETLKSDIKIQLDQDTIIINYKNDELRYYDAHNSNTLNNPYIYMGLQKALYQFINEFGTSDKVVYVDEMEVPEDGLNFKLYNLLLNKKVNQVSIDTVDEVIYKISDRIIEKHVKAVKRLYENGN